MNVYLILVRDIIYIIYISKNKWGIKKTGMFIKNIFFEIVQGMLE